MPGLLIRRSEWWLSCNLLWGETVWSKCGQSLYSPLLRGVLLDHVCPQSIGHSSISALSETYSLPFSKSKVEFPFPPIKELLVYIDVLDLTDELCWKVENELWLQRTPHIFLSLPFNMPEDFITENMDDLCNFPHFAVFCFLSHFLFSSWRGCGLFLHLYFIFFVQLNGRA